MATSMCLFCSSTLSVLFLFTGVVLHLAGLSTPRWSSYRSRGVTESYGLWSHCGDRGCVPYTEKQLTDSLKVCEAFAILGMLASVLALVSSLLDVVFACCWSRHKTLFYVMAYVACCVSFFCIVISVSVWAGKVHLTRRRESFNIGYSLILSAVGGSLIGFAGLFIFVYRKVVTS